MLIWALILCVALISTDASSAVERLHLKHITPKEYGLLGDTGNTQFTVVAVPTDFLSISEMYFNIDADKSLPTSTPIALSENKGVFSVNLDDLKTSYLTMVFDYSEIYESNKYTYRISFFELAKESSKLDFSLLAKLRGNGLLSE